MHTQQVESNLDEKDRRIHDDLNTHKKNYEGQIKKMTKEADERWTKLIGLISPMQRHQDRFIEQFEEHDQKFDSFLD